MKLLYVFILSIFVTTITGFSQTQTYLAANYSSLMPSASDKVDVDGGIGIGAGIIFQPNTKVLSKIIIREVINRYSEYTNLYYKLKKDYTLISSELIIEFPYIGFSKLNSNFFFLVGLGSLVTSVERIGVNRQNPISYYDPQSGSELMIVHGAGLKVNANLSKMRFSLEGVFKIVSSPYEVFNNKLVSEITLSTYLN